MMRVDLVFVTLQIRMVRQVPEILFRRTTMYGNLTIFSRSVAILPQVNTTQRPVASVRGAVFHHATPMLGYSSRRLKLAFDTTGEPAGLAEAQRRRISLLKAWHVPFLHLVLALEHRPPSLMYR